MLEALKKAVCEANLSLVDAGLVVLTWGNVSGIDRERGLVIIKPSGVPYEGMRPEDQVVVDLEGAVVEGARKPSCDLPTHLALYRGLPGIGGVAHTHSAYATAFAQAGRPIPCLGTTHADQFRGPVPLTRVLSPEEMDADYTGNTGRTIMESLAALDVESVPGVLVRHHGPFTWGASAGAAARAAIALEAVARMAFKTLVLDTSAPELPGHYLARHHGRKHGPGAYYGQG